MSQNTKKYYQSLKKFYVLSGELAYDLVVFGDAIAKREKYKDNDGIEAVHFYLMQKHHWLPAQVKSMSFDDLRFALSEEMSGWTLPANARE